MLLDFRLQVLHRIPISWQAPLELVEDVLRDGLTAKMLRQAACNGRREEARLTMRQCSGSGARLAHFTPWRSNGKAWPSAALLGRLMAQGAAPCTMEFFPPILQYRRSTSESSPSLSASTCANLKKSSRRLRPDLMFALICAGVRAPAVTPLTFSAIFSLIFVHHEAKIP